MKLTKQELAGLTDGSLQFEESIQAGPEELAGYKRIRRLPAARLIAKGHYDKDAERLYLDFDLSGMMVVPCDITLEDVELPFHTTEEAVYSFPKTEDPDVIQAENGIIDTLPEALLLISMEIPLKVVKPGPVTYPKGEGWEVVREEDYEQDRQRIVDPRLAVLKNYQPKD